MRASQQCRFRLIFIRQLSGNPALAEWFRPHNGNIPSLGKRGRKGEKKKEEETKRK